MNLYHYLYFRFYWFNIRINGEDFFPNYCASLMLGVVVAINFLTIAILSDLVLADMGILKLPDLPKPVVGAVGLLYLLINYFYFSKGDKYKEIIADFNGKNVSQSWVFSFIYLFLSLFVFFMVLAVGFFIRNSA